MKEFSDEFLKGFIDQKADEFEPNDTLQPEWENISKKLPRRRYTATYYAIAALTGVALLLVLVNNEPSSEAEKLNIKMSASLAQGPKQDIPEQNIRRKETGKTSGSIENTNAKTDRVRKNNSKITKAHSENSQIEIAAAQMSFEKSFEIQKAKNAEVKDSNVENSEEKQTEIIKTEQIVAVKSDSTSSEQPSTKEDHPVETKIWSTYLGLFYNSNRFVPTEGDPVYIHEFDQSSNPFANRLGVKITLGSPSIKTVFGKINGTISYGFLQKKYSFKYQQLNEEQILEHHIYSVHAFNHLLSAGVSIQFHPRISAGAEYQYVYNAGRGNDAFASQYVLLNLSSAVYQKENVHLSAFAEYGLPLKGQKFLNVHQINIGMRVRVFSFTTK